MIYCPVDDRCSKSAQKSAVQVCQVAIVVMETRQLILSRFKAFYRSQWRIEQVSLSLSGKSN